MNISASLIRNLPVDKRKSFLELIRDGKSDQESFKKWVQEQNLSEEKEILEKINAVYDKSTKDFFGALVSGLDNSKKEEAITFAKGYLNG